MHQAVNRVRATLALLAAALGLASCGTHENNHLGVVLIQDEGELKAVRLVSVAAPDSTSNYVLAAPPEAGLQTSILVTARPGFFSRTLVRFAPDAFPAAGTTVDSAFVELRVVDAFGSPSPMGISVYRVTSEWNEATVTADSLPGIDGLVLGHVDVPIVPSVIDTFRVAVGPLAQSWVDSTAANFGLALIPDAGAGAELELSTRESGEGVKLVVYTTSNGEVVTTTLAATADATHLMTTPSYVSPIGLPGRLTVARGLPARILLKFPWPDLGDRATVNRAEIVLHVDGAQSFTNGAQIGVQRVIEEPWSGESTDVNTLLYGLTTVKADADSVVFAMTGIADALLDEDDHGVQLRALREDQDTDIVVFHGADTEVPGKEPHVRIWYTPGSGTEETP